MTKEIWKPVVGMETFYDVSNLGRVRTHHRLGCNPLGILHPVPNKKGYFRVCLTGGGKRFTRVVQRLVLDAFHGPQPSSIHESNHKDGKKKNNRWDNLEWVTPVENNAHSVANGFWHPHIGEAHGRAKIKESDVNPIRQRQGKESAKSVARRYKVSHSAIRLIWKRINWKHVK